MSEAPWALDLEINKTSDRYDNGVEFFSGLHISMGISERASEIPSNGSERHASLG